VTTVQRDQEEHARSSEAVHGIGTEQLGHRVCRIVRERRTRLSQKVLVDALTFAEHATQLGQKDTCTIPCTERPGRDLEVVIRIEEDRSTASLIDANSRK
jgi:hypothetical protein